jgi:hypothetical protein
MGDIKLNSNNRRVAWLIVFLVGLIGVGNLVVGVWSLLAISSLNMPHKISDLNSVIDSIDPSYVGAPELKDQISNLKTTVIEELSLFHDYSKQLNLMPAHFILQGIIFMAVSSAIYFIIPKSEKVRKHHKKP